MRCCISVDSITTMSDTHSRHTIRSLPLLTTRYCPSCYRVSRKSVCLCAGLSPGSLCTVYREIFHWCRIRTERAGLGRGGRGRSERGQSGERSEERGLGAGHSTARPRPAQAPHPHLPPSKCFSVHHNNIYINT